MNALNSQSQEEDIRDSVTAESTEPPIPSQALSDKEAETPGHDASTETVSSNAEAVDEEDSPKGIIARTRAKVNNFFANMAERVGPSLDQRLNELKKKDFLNPIEEREMTIRQKLATIRPFALAIAVAPLPVPTFGIKPLLTAVAYGVYHGLSIASIKAMQTRAAIGNKVASVLGRNTNQELLAA